MKGFQIKISNKVFSGLKKIPKDRQKQILNKIELITKSPEMLDIRKMGGRADTYRLRIGDYRVIFVVDFADKTIHIDNLGTRQEIEKHY